MRVTIELHATQPLEGSLQAEGCSPEAFVGWLGLINVMNELVKQGVDPGSIELVSGKLRGPPNARGAAPGGGGV